MAIWSIVMLPLFVAIMCSGGIAIGIRKRNRHATERARWRAEYKASPESHLLNLSETT
jgi:hypothetical protein